MTIPTRLVDRPGRRLADGALRLLLADALAVPAGLALAAYLTRRLGPSAYGLFVVAATITASLEWTLATVFSRVTIKMVSDATDRERAASVLLRLQLVASLIVGAGLWLLAGPAGTIVGMPALTSGLRLFALDVPLFTLASAHWQIGVGLSRFRPRAAGVAARWLSRLVLAVIFVESGFSTMGAIAASIGASAVEVAVARRYVQPRVFGRVGSLRQAFPRFVLPLVMYALSMRLLDKVDLLMLGALGAGTVTAGIYGAAQGLALLPGLVAQALGPLTLATVNHLLHDGREQEARDVARQALRAVLWLVPVAAVVAGSARNIVTLVFGDPYAAAAGPLALLIVAAVAQAAIGVASMILTARDRAGLIWAIGGALCPAAIVAHVFAIPRWGAAGAGAVTLAVSVAGAGAMWTALAWSWHLRPPRASVYRAAVASALGYGLAVWAGGVSSPVPVQLAVVGAVVVAALLAMGEFTASDWTALRALAQGTGARGMGVS